MRGAFRVKQEMMFSLPSEPEPRQDAVIPLVFDGQPIRVVTIDGQPWWVLADVAKTLGYGQTSDASRLLRDKHKRSHVLNSVPQHNVLGNVSRDHTVISEGGLYRLIMKSRSPVADSFQDWVTDEVLPSIRKTGTYSVPGSNVLGDLGEAKRRNLDVNRARQQESGYGVPLGCNYGPRIDLRKNLRPRLAVTPMHDTRYKFSDAQSPDAWVSRFSRTIG